MVMHAEREKAITIVLASTTVRFIVSMGLPFLDYSYRLLFVQTALVLCKEDEPLVNGSFVDRL